MVPARAELRAAGQARPGVANGHAGGQRDPALVQQRRAARREARRPDQLDRIGLHAQVEPRGGDGQEVVVHHVQEVARREAVGGVENVRLAPADELLAQLERDRPPAVRGAQPAHRKCRPLPLAVLPGEAPGALDLVVRVGARVDPPGQPPVRRELVGGLVAHERRRHRAAPVVRRGLRIEDQPRLQKAAVREVLRRRRQPRGQQHQGELHDSRRSACKVKSASRIGRLYWSFSSFSTVRLLRRRSSISISRGVQMPCTICTSR